MKAKLFPGLTSLVVTITLVASFPSFATHDDTGTLVEDGTLVPILLQIRMRFPEVPPVRPYLSSRSTSTRCPA